MLRNLAETENRPVYIQDAVVTQNSLIQYAKDKDGVEWRVKHMSTERMYTEASAKIAQGITDWPTMQAFVFSSIFGEGYGQDFSDHLDNELLGLKGMTNDEVKALIESRVP